MGNRKRFKLSDMIPNSWFYKLKELGTKRTSKPNHHFATSPLPTTPRNKRSNSISKAASQAKPKLVPATSELQQQQGKTTYINQPRKSYHFTRQLNDQTTPKVFDASSNHHHLLYNFPDPPRKSARRRRSTKRKSTSSSTTTTTRYSSSCSSPSPRKFNSSSSVSFGSSTKAVESFKPKSDSQRPLTNDTSFSSVESDCLSMLPQFSPPEYALLSVDSQLAMFDHHRAGGKRSCTSLSCSCKEKGSSDARADDIVIDVEEKSSSDCKQDGNQFIGYGYDSVSQGMELPPINVTKKKTTKSNQLKSTMVDESSANYKKKNSSTATTRSTTGGRRSNNSDRSLPSVKVVQETEKNGRISNYRAVGHDSNSRNSTNKVRSPMRRFVVNSPTAGVVGLKLRLSSPRIGIGRKWSVTAGEGGGVNNGGGGVGGRKSVSSSGVPSSTSKKKSTHVSESFAIVKSSVDPQKDFMESMVEMIVQNNIKGSKELEELLAAYLTLNSEEYHGVIFNVFKQIWMDLDEIHRTQRQRRVA